MEKYDFKWNYSTIALLCLQDRQDSLRSSQFFKDLARRDAEETMAEELEKLLATAPPEIQEVDALLYP